MTGPGAGSWAALCALVLAASPGRAHADAPTLGAHPRLLLGGSTKAQLVALAKQPGTATAKAVAICDDVIAHPKNYNGGYEGLGFAAPFGACAIAWVARGDQPSGAMAVTYFKALLDDYSAVGAGDGGDDVVQHDDGYSFRIFAPYAAIGYDWLRDAPGMSDSLLSHARERFAAWTKWYAASGYHNDQPGANYHAGYVVGATLIAVAEAGEAGGDGDALWDHVTNDIWTTQLGPATGSDGVLAGGDWLEGWEYGPLSVSELAMAARALRGNGVDVSLSPWSSWESAVMLRTLYAQTPTANGAYIGGDSQGTTPNLPVEALTLSAVTIDNASDAAKSWAMQLISDQQLGDSDFPLPVALGEADAPAPAAYGSDAPTSFVAAGSRTLYARTDWSASATWLVSQCAWHRVDDHMFFAAGNFVLTRGADDLVVDPSPYGTLSTLTTNAPTATSAQLPTEYQPSQGAWGTEPTVLATWMNQRKSGVMAARCDYAGQYRFMDTASDVPHAVRDLVVVPYGSGDAVAVVIDDATAATAAGLDIRFHANAAFTNNGGVARAHVGASDLVIQLATATTGTPALSVPSVTDCSSAPRGKCDTARFPAGEWTLAVGAQTAQAITVLDAIATGENPAAPVTSSGTGWHATELDRTGTHIAVIAIDPGLTTVTYTAKAGTHVVVGAPASADGMSDVTAVAAGGACAVTVAPHAGGTAIDAQPLAISVDASCAVTADPPRAPAVADAGGSAGSDDDPPGPASAGGGCGCASSGGQLPFGDAIAPALLVLVLVSVHIRRRRT